MTARAKTGMGRGLLALLSGLLALALVLGPGGAHAGTGGHATVVASDCGLSMPADCGARGSSPRSGHHAACPAVGGVCAPALPASAPPLVMISSRVAAALPSGDRVWSDRSARHVFRPPIRRA